MRDDWRRYVAPAAFLLAATVAIVLIRSGMHAGGAAAERRVTVPTATRKHVVATTTTKKPGKTTTGSRKFWTVEAGDSFGVISTKTGVPVATIEQLNPGVSSTSLVIGQKVRIR